MRWRRQQPAPDRASSQDAAAAAAAVDPSAGAAVRSGSSASADSSAGDTWAAADSAAADTVDSAPVDGAASAASADSADSADSAASPSSADTVGQFADPAPAATDDASDAPAIPSARDTTTAADTTGVDLITVVAPSAEPATVESGENSGVDIFGTPAHTAARDSASHQVWAPSSVGAAAPDGQAGEPAAAGVESERRQLIELLIYAWDRARSPGVWERLTEGLASVGVSVERPDGQRFDPTRHEVGGVEVTDDDSKVDLIAETELAGFTDRGVVLRDPVVVVYRRE
ncbi:hypothetical protein [Nakamurella aerolata]|uniref:hypothetical protein n=1 Tax=Nakamurella aerolata TaxID=1656892 RepID=UPI001BB219E0|nr:hypothetical protein [Nakamurella aerolata]